MQTRSQAAKSGAGAGKPKNEATLAIKAPAFVIKRSRAKTNRNRPASLCQPQAKFDETKEALATIRKRLAEMSLDPEAEHTQLAVAALVKRLHRKGAIEKLHDFVKVVEEKSADQCVPLERCRDGRMQVGLLKVFPVVSVFNLYVDSRATKTSIVQLPLCKMGCSTTMPSSEQEKKKVTHDCINPWHYELSSKWNYDERHEPNTVEDVQTPPSMSSHPDVPKEQKKSVVHDENTEIRTQDPVETLDFDFSSIPMDFSDYSDFDARGPLELRYNPNGVDHLSSTGPLAQILQP
ncbi:hypothetical protein QR680_010440 [Steinernema hermaphroditum]|uniref:MH1 domain-containing protein n=1 Tax=Steinernema hermaphroditum TaxID=289476 RepID=A0AA39MBK1_9BILA|nr:hypothetical protein QR680_010440 [Steinernema hermaphroditum]